MPADIQKKHFFVIRLVIAYCLVLYCVWAVVELWLSPRVGLVNSEWFKESVIKTLVWTVPAVYLMVRYQKILAITLREMFAEKVRWRTYLPWFMFFTAYIGMGAFFARGTIALSPSFEPHQLIIVLFVGLSEEIVFRGWLLNLTIRVWGERRKWLAIAVNAVLFLLIHFPVWMRTGQFFDMFTSLNFVAILGLSIIFSITFLKSRSIWVPIALHMYWNLLVFLLL